MSAAVVARIMPLLATPELADLGPGPRAGVEPEAVIKGSLNAAFAQSPLSPVCQQLVHSLVLLWHDHLDASHTISQGIETADGSFVHAIMHRREPDAWNAKYWWRRVGKHPAFPEIARRVGGLFDANRLHTSAATNADLASRIVPDGCWDASAFVDVCDSARDEDLIRTLREIQRIETEVLLEHFCHE
jgi:hypothetical protein